MKEKGVIYMNWSAWTPISHDARYFTIISPGLPDCSDMKCVDLIGG